MDWYRMLKRYATLQVLLEEYVTSDEEEREWKAEQEYLERIILDTLKEASALRMTLKSIKALVKHKV